MPEHDYEPIEHTADLGLRFRGRRLADLYLNAARGMLLATIRPGPARRVTVRGEDRVSLLFEWLRDLLYRFNVHKVIGYPERIEALTETTLEAVVREDPIDPAHHVLRHEVKAVTYHELSIQEGPEGWTGQAIFDV